MAIGKNKNKGKKVQGQDMTNIELGQELGGGTQQEAAQITQLKKAKKKK